MSFADFFHTQIVAGTDAHCEALFEELEPRLLLSNSWPIEVVDAPGDVGSFASLAVGGSTGPDRHISYYDETGGNLKYAMWDAGTELWTTSTVDSGGNVGQHTSIALDTSWNPHISYYDATNGSLKYTRWDDGDARWEEADGTAGFETVDSSIFGVGSFTSLALDSSGQARISYYDAFNEQLKYAAWDAGGGTWDIEVVEDSTAGDTFLEFNDDQDQLSGYENLTGVTGANSDGGTLYVSLIYDDILAEWRTEIYKDDIRSDLVAHTDVGTNPGTRIIFEDGGSGIGGSIVWDQLVEPGNLGQDLDIRITLIGTPGGPYNSLDLDAAGKPQIAFYDANDGDLKYAKWTPGVEWTIETVDDAGDVGQNVSLALTSAGRPRIAYYDATNGDLKYAAWDGGAWTTETVDDTGDVGQFASIDLDAADKPHITYLDYTNGDLKYAGWTASWAIEVVDAVGWDSTTAPGMGLNAGVATSLVIGASGKAQIAYHNYTNTNLNFTMQNYRPTLTSMTTLAGAAENVPFTITYAMLAAAGNEADPEGAAISFRIESVENGTLTKGGVPVVPGVTLIGAGEELVWTPPADTSGDVTAFKVKAWDGLAASDDPAVDVVVNIGANARPTLTTVNTLHGAVKDTAFTISYATLAAAADEADADGDPITFIIQGVTNGTLTKGGAPVVPGTTTLAAGETLVWTPPAGFTGETEAFTIIVTDGVLMSEPDVAVNVDVSSALGLALDESKLPATLIPGSKKNGVIKKVIAIVTNNTGAFFTGPVTLRLYVSADGTLNDATLLDTVSKTVKLKIGKAKKITFKKVIVPELTPGGYKLVVDGALTNPLATIRTIFWGTATFDLTGIIKNTTFTVNPSYKENYKGTILNQGSSDVSQRVRVELYGSSDLVLDTAADTFMAAFDGVLTVRAGKKRGVKLNFTRLDYGLGDTFTLIILVDADDDVAETDETNNEAMAVAVQTTKDAG